MNTLLQRQIHKCLGDPETLSSELLLLLDAISDAYDGFETDRQLMERSLDISSQELRESKLQELRKVNQKLCEEIAERQQAQQHLAKSLNEVVKANNELTHFAYVISHDLKSPLRGISTLAEWISHDHGQDLCEEVREQLDLIHNRTKRMHALIEGLLAFSQIKPIPEHVVSVSLNDLVKHLINTIALPETITVTIAEELPMIRCERHAVTQIFRHLLDNAIKFMDKPHGRITIGCTDQSDDWQFHFSDNGPGIEAQYFDKIFRMFQTLEQWELSHATGIGLPIVKKAIEMHGGEIWIESKVGKGTTFVFTLSKQM